LKLQLMAGFSSTWSHQAFFAHFDLLDIDRDQPIMPEFAPDVKRGDRRSRFL